MDGIHRISLPGSMGLKAAQRQYPGRLIGQNSHHPWPEIHQRNRRMLISDLDPNNLSFAQINKLLFENIEDDGFYGDCILVFGSLTAAKYRIPKSVELYQGKRASKVLLSGGTILKDQNISEAVMMRARAIELGVNPNDILLEQLSLNTIENVLASMIILNREFKLRKIKRILVVSTYYHLKRCFLALKTYMPKWIEYSLCPAIDPVTDPNQWLLNEIGKEKYFMKPKH